ncbi:DUF169 domain-containing protein [Myxococcota bacterium]|nr:DUF169 domain-containing protein [Myxococcota bacterium]
MRALRLTVPPVGLRFVDAPAASDGAAPRVTAGCVFWQEGARRSFATTSEDHASCAIGQYTHGLPMDAASSTDLDDVMKVMGELGYLRPEDMAFVPQSKKTATYVAYGPLAEAPSPPDVVLLFVRADQQLVLTEATQQLEQGLAPAMGRPACAIVSQSINTGRAALSLGCCGARAYVDALTPDVALYAIPGARLAEYAERIASLAQANDVLTGFHRVRRGQIEAGERPSVRASLAVLQAR